MVATSDPLAQVRHVVAADAVRFVRLDNGADADTTGGGGAP